MRLLTSPFFHRPPPLPRPQPNNRTWGHEALSLTIPNSRLVTLSTKKFSKIPGESLTGGALNNKRDCVLSEQGQWSCCQNHLLSAHCLLLWVGRSSRDSFKEKVSFPGS